MHDVHRSKPYTSENRLFRKREKTNIGVKKIKKIITALLNESINNELKKYKNIEVMTNDLLYQEAVLEYINENKDIDFLLLNENLPGEKIESFIEKIPQIKIILFAQKSRKNEEILIQKGVYKIYTESEISVEKIIEIIEKNENNYTEKLEKEIEELKRKIMQSQKEENKFINIIEKIRKKEKNQIQQKGKIISITGTNEHIKAILTIIIAKKLERKKSKILIIDLDILNQEIFKILKIKNKEEQNLKIENHIIEKNKYLNILSGSNLLFKINEEISIYEIENIIEKLKEKYNYIIINTSKECFFELNKNILEKTNSIIFTIEKSIKEIEKSINLLKIYWEIWKIEKSKFNIIITQTKNKNILSKKLKIIDKIPYKTK